MWGNPSEIELIPLVDNFILTTAMTGDVWYYLNKDINAGFLNTIYLGSPSDTAKTHVRILLNGYTISGNFDISPNSSHYTVSIFDKIPNQDENQIGYQYNKDSLTKYYKFSSATGAYTEYTTEQPTGQDVTAMPTFAADSYIKVTGSAFAPNNQTTNDTTTTILAEYGTVNFFGIHVIGNNMNQKNMSFVTTDLAGKANLYQCTIFGNLFGGFGAISMGTDSEDSLTLIGCNLYGNQTRAASVGFGIQPSNTAIAGRENDLKMHDTSNAITLYKNDIGAISMLGTGNILQKAIYVKGVDFGQNFQFSMQNLEKSIANISNITGTIELVYQTNLNYNAESPNLNFIIHGGDSQGTPKKGYNQLAIGQSAVVNTVTTVFNDPVPGKITVAGIVKGLDTAGSLEVLSGQVTLLEPATTNTINLTLSGGELIVTSSQIHLPDSIVIEKAARLTVNEDVVITSKVDNKGTLCLAGTLQNLLPNGGNVEIFGTKASLPASYAVEENTTFTVLENAEYAADLTNNGTVYLAGTFSGTVYNNNAMHILTGGKYTIAEKTKLTGNVTCAGVLQVAGELPTITIEEGAEIVVLSNSALLPMGYQVLKNTTLTIGEGVQYNAYLVNYGTVKLTNGATVTNMESSNGNVYIFEGASFTVDRGKTFSGNIINDGSLTIAGIAQSIEGSGSFTIEPRSKATVPINAVLSGNMVNNGELIIEGSYISVDRMTNNGRLTIAKNANVTVPAMKSVEGTVVSYGNLIVDGIIDNLTTKIDSITQFVDGATISNLQIDGGEVILRGKVNIPREIHLPEQSILQVNNGAVVEKVYSAGAVLVTTDGVIVDLFNSGELAVEKNGSVQNLISRGYTVVYGNIGNATIEDGYVLVEEYGKITYAELNGGIVEVKENGAVVKFKQIGSQGQFINHNPNRDITWLWIIIVGVLLFLIADGVVIFIVIRRKREKEDAAGFFKYRRKADVADNYIVEKYQALQKVKGKTVKKSKIDPYARYARLIEPFEEIKNTEKTENKDQTEKLEKADNVENIEKTESTKSRENTEQTKNTQTAKKADSDTQVIDKKEK